MGWLLGDYSKASRWASGKQYESLEGWYSRTSHLIHAEESRRVEPAVYIRWKVLCSIVCQHNTVLRVGEYDHWWVLLWESKWDSFDWSWWGIVWNTLPVEGVTEFTLSPGKNYSVAVFVPEKKVCIPCVSFPVYAIYLLKAVALWTPESAEEHHELYIILTTSS